MGGTHRLPSWKHVLERRIVPKEKLGLAEGVVGEGVLMFRPQEAAEAEAVVESEEKA